MGPLPNGRTVWLINGGDPNYLQVLGWSSKCAHWHSYCAADPCVQTLLWSVFFPLLLRRPLQGLQSCRSTVHHLKWKSALATICLKRNIFKEGSGSNSRFRRRLAEILRSGQAKIIQIHHATSAFASTKKLSVAKSCRFLVTFRERILVPSHSVAARHCSSIEHVCKFYERYHTHPIHPTHPMSDVASSMYAAGFMNAITVT